MANISFIRTSPEDWSVFRAVAQSTGVDEETLFHTMLSKYVEGITAIAIPVVGTISDKGIIHFDGHVIPAAEVMLSDDDQPDPTEDN